MGEIFGTRENFERYQITRLLEQQLMVLRSDKRLILAGYGNFRQHHRQVHDLMTRLSISHEYRDGPQGAHDWHGGWVEPAVGLLLNCPGAHSEATLPQERTR